MGTTVLGNQRRPKTMMTWLDLAVCMFVTMDDRLDTKHRGGFIIGTGVWTSLNRRGVFYCIILLGLITGHVPCCPGEEIFS